MTSKMKTKQFKWLAATLMLVAAMVMPSTAWAQTMYTVFDTSSGTLTFKYDSSKPSDTENVYEIPTSTFTPGWITAHASAIKKVVFDASFANARPTMCFAWFQSCSALEEIEGIANLNTSEVNDMRFMFYGCSRLTSLNLSGFDTHKVEYMGDMFCNCNNLQTIFVSDNFVTTAVKSSSKMFSGCNSIEGAILYDPSKTDATYANCTTGYFTKEGTVATPKGAYAIYTLADNTLTFSYGTIPAPVEGVSAVYNIPTVSTAPGWITAHASAIKRVVFDASFANVRPTKCYSWFDGCSALEKIEGIANLNTSEVTDMSYMFHGCSRLTSLDLSGFDTHKVESMNYMFRNCKNLQTIFVSDNFVTNVVKSSSDMFSGCNSIEGAIIYDSSKTDAKYANYTDGYFTKEGTVATPKGAYAIYTAADNTLTFNYGEIPAPVEGVSAVYNIPTVSTSPGWKNAPASDIKKVVFDASFANVRPTMCYSWFYRCSALEEIQGIANLNTSEVTSMRYMFDGCSRLTSLDLSGFDTQKVGYMDYMFRNCYNLKTIFVSDNFVTTAVKSSSDMFSGCNSIEGAITYDPGKTDATYANYTNGYFTKEGTVATPKGAYAIYTVADNTLTFKYGEIPTSVEGVSAVYNIPISSTTPGWKTAHASAIKKVVFDASFADVRPTTCYCWFEFCSQLTAIQGLAYLNTSEVTSMYCMFRGCSSLTSLDLSGFDTQKVEYMDYMFSNCKNLQTIFVSDNFVTTDVKSSSNMFSGCTSIEGAILYDPSKTDATYAKCTTGYFTNVSEKANFGSLAVYNSSSYTLTFKYGKKTKLDTGETAYELNTAGRAPGWINNTGITKVVFEMSFANALPTSCFQWFKGLSSLTTIEGIGYLNTSEVTDMNEMFSGCSSLSSLQLTTFNTAKVTDMNEMFSGCSNLTSLQLKAFNTAKVTDMTRMFYNCFSLKTIYTSNLFDVTGVTVSDEMFTGCKSLVGAITYDAGKVTKDYANSETGYFSHEPEGEGTSELPFLIKTASDFAWFRDHVNEGNSTACARLEADIDMSSVCHAANESEGVEELSWVPISDKSIVGSNYWYGTFDGNNKTLANLYINATADNSGLFGYLYNQNVKGTIKNINFENVSVTSTAEDLGVLAGYARNTDISGIMVNSGTVKGAVSCGGIVGQAIGVSISNCVNKANIEGRTQTGAIGGYLSSTTITKCANYGNVQGYREVGGIAGYLEGSTWENVFTSGNVTYSYPYSCKGLVIGKVSGNLTLSGYVIYNSDAKLYYNTNEQPTQAFDGSGSVTGEGKAIGLTADQLKNGWGTWLLNGEKAVGAWGQTIGTDDYPTLGGNPIYPQDAARNCIFTDFTGTFTNSVSEATVTFTHGTPTYHPAVPNTCTNGNVEYYECNDCHRTYKDEAMTQLIEDVFLPRQHAHHDFGENYICKNCSTAMPVVSLGDTDVTIDKTDDNDNQYGYNLFKYVADDTGTLYVKAYGSADTEGALWTALGSEVTAAATNDDESTEETDFSLTYAVTQGETYIIGVRQKSKEAISGNYILRLRGSWTTTANREGLEPFFIVGDGTEASPYELSDASCLTWFASVVNGGNTTACAILTNDITFTGNFTAIGNSESNPYAGTFDGKGHTVKVNQSGSDDVALFGQIGACTIKNLKVTGTINTSVKYAAGFAMHKQGTGTGMK